MQQIKSYPKFNLFLEILNKNPITNYHYLHTMMFCLSDIYDTISITADDKFSISVKGRYIFNGENILEKTVKHFKEVFNKNTNFKVEITKNIKFGAGLGGGSSNAAFFLNFLLKQNNIILTRSEFCQFAIKIGADVPFFYDTKPKICKMYGEELADVPFALPQSLYVLLVLPQFSINTASIFKQITQATYKHNASNITSFIEALKIGNDLENFAYNVKPELLDIIKNLNSLPNVLKAGLSGSGSVCFALFYSLQDAERAKDSLQKSYEVVISKVKTS